MFSLTQYPARATRLGQCLLLGALLAAIGCGGSGSGGGKPGSSSASSSSQVSSSLSSSSESSQGQSSSSSSSGPAELSLLKAQGTHWVNAAGEPVLLKGTNLGNWLVQEFWMMGQGGNGVHDQCTLEAELTERFGYEEKERLIKLFRDNWIKERDFDQLQAFGFNLVRLPILWNVIEDETQPKTLREDAWHYIDWTIAEAKKRGMYVILDLHGALGGQTPNDHTGCSGQNHYWTNRDYQERTLWLWQQIAERYKDEPAVAAYDPLNEPWGSSAEAMAERVLELYDTIRAIDDRHIILLHSHYGSIDVYGKPAEAGLTNVAFQLHPYPGLFGDRPGDSHYDIQRDWLRCGDSGTGGVCEWNTRLSALDTPMLMGEFQPWQSAGLELGGKLGRATYDTYASYGWASTSWAYKLVSIAGSQGQGTWGMVTNAINTQLDVGTGLITKASTWDCAGWDSSFADACARKATSINPGGEGEKTYYLVIKTGANGGADPDVSYDSISLKHSETGEERLVNGNFGSGAGWTSLSIAGSLQFDYNNTDTGKQPGGSEGAVLRITRPDGVSGEINGAIYQAVTLQAGQTYHFSGVFKDNGSSNTWAEIYLVEDEPVAGVDVVDNAGKVDFTTASIEEIEALFTRYGDMDYDVHSGLAHWLVTDEHNDVFDYPPRPTNLQLTESGNSVSLSWSPANGDTVSYSVYRATTPGAKGEPIAEELTQNTYSDTRPDADQTYFYTVTARNHIAESYRSNEVHTALQYVPVPARIQAENYTAMSGIQTENCGDTGGGLNVGHFHPNDFIEFKISVASAGTFTIDYRLASQTGSTGFEALIDGEVVDTQTLAATGGWQTYITKTGASFPLSAGNHTLRFRSIGQEWNINWFEVKQQ
ncbi:cellulase family glycosylhydrolase [Cellvibrio japonicus]|uniref:Glucan exo-1,3-beta glucosidase, putative, glu5A n=1 Tax=Cellvibrio japonicus (strain Ueda107) TaxID=498211 RepID=B3PEK3_CELJU|nr:cellulase family glycosylhydrolase [Cellvibrio japonicus]ACE82980.1 glucan exo-1,3-beta glucosidase, putative, glu5A [Cellvibrio japonicus Ueda107]